MAVKLSILFLLGFLASTCFGNDQFGQVHLTTMKHVSAGPGFIWGVTSKDYIYRCDNPCTKWTKMDGKLIQIDVGDSEVWGVNSAHQIWKRPADGSGKWTKIPGGLKHVSASGNGYIWGVNRNDQIYKCKKPCSGKWVNVPGGLKQIDGGHKYVYGVNKNDAIFARPIDGSGAWRQIPGSLKHISGSGSEAIFGVNKSDHIFRCPKPCVGQWERMQGGLKQCDATFNGLIGVSNEGTIWHHTIGA